MPSAWKRTIFLLCLLGAMLGVSPRAAVAAVAFDSLLFTDNMILQQGVPVPIWGTAAPEELVVVEFAGQLKGTISDLDGRWTIELDPLAAAGPSQLRALSIGTIIVLEDVQVGEVWVCGGQSNMALSTRNPGQLAGYPHVRALVDSGWSDGPGEVCWLFGVELAQELGVAVGLINNASPGSKIRNWLGPSVLTDPDPAVAPIVADYDDWGRLYDQRVAPLQPYPVRGVAWWQGESDRREAEEHAHILPAMIRSWRQGWGIGEIPFVIVHVPTGGGLPWGNRLRRLPRSANRSHRRATMRQAFIETLAVPATSLALSGDLRGGTHPPASERPLYAHRLVKAAMADVYGEDIPASGPVFDSVSRDGDALRVRFRGKTATGLKPTPAATVRGFAVTANGEDWVWADADVIGEEVLVWSDEVPQPIAVRYGWGKRYTFANLFNGEDHAAAPFQAPVVPGP